MDWATNRSANLRLKSARILAQSFLAAKRLNHFQAFVFGFFVIGSLVNTACCPHQPDRPAILNRSKTRIWQEHYRYGEYCPATDQVPVGPIIE